MSQCVRVCTYVLYKRCNSYCASGYIRCKIYDNAGGNVVATNCFDKIESDSDHIIWQRGISGRGV